MTDTDYQTLRTETTKRVLTVTLNRPDKLNAFNGTMLAELLEVIDRVDRDDEIRAVIVTGAGRGFCAGADLSEGGSSFRREGEREEEHRDGGGLLTLRLFESTNPWIAAVNGPAVGVGVTMTLPMDVRIASDAARFGFVFARRGLVPEAASSWFLPRVVGISQAMEWVATGRVFGAEEARAGGLVSQVVPAEDLLDAAREIALEIAEHTSQISVALSRQLMWKLLGAAHPMEAHRLDSKAIYALGRSADVREGVTSFLEKRPPRFPGRVSKDLPDFYPWAEPPAFQE